MPIDENLLKQILLSLKSLNFQAKRREKTFSFKIKESIEYDDAILFHLQYLKDNGYLLDDNITIGIHGDVQSFENPISEKGEHYLQNWFSKHKKKIIYGLISLIFAPILVDIILKKYVD
jgi:hypothetical protein